MGFTKQKLALFFSMPLDATDWRNLQLAGVRRVMLPLWMAHSQREMLGKLAQMQVRVVLRAEEESYYDDQSPTLIEAAVHDILNIIAVDAVIVGCEPENNVDFRYGSPDWGQSQARHHAGCVQAVAQVLKSIEGVEIVSPGWMMRSISEDEPPQPGRVVWREICEPVYNARDGAGYHLYQYGWKSYVDELRARFALKSAQELFHKPLWIDEFNVSAGPPVERMAACIKFATMLLTHTLGQRVEMVAPFVSNGTGQGYDPGYIMRDRACYEALGQWMRS